MSCSRAPAKKKVAEAARLHRKDIYINTIMSKLKPDLRDFSILTAETYAELVFQVKGSKGMRKKTPEQQRRLKKFNVITVDGVDKLVAHGDYSHRFYLCLEEIFTILDGTHLANGHMGMELLKQKTEKKFANITEDLINLYISSCNECGKKSIKNSKPDYYNKAKQGNDRAKRNKASGSGGKLTK